MKYVREQLEASRAAAHCGANNNGEVVNNPQRHLGGGGYPLSTPKNEGDSMQLPTLASSGLLPQNKRSISEIVDRHSSANIDKSEVNDQPPLARVRSS